MVIRTENLGKCYQFYEQPLDRLKQALWRGRRKYFKEFWALRDVTLAIGKGETVGIIGANGSGKSTLLQLICGILTPTVGTIDVKGRVSALLELGAGFNPEFSGAENIYMNAAVMGLSRREIEARYEDIVAFADIGEFINRPVKTYSSGMYVRLAFATAINISPDILVVDEALSVGDIRFQQKCVMKIKTFCQNGTVIFVSHDTGVVTDLCSRVIWMNKGAIQMDGTPKRVVEKYIEYMYDEKSRNGADGPQPAPETEAVRVEDMDGYLTIDDSARQFGNRRAVIRAVAMQSGRSGNGVVYAGRVCRIAMILDVHDDIAGPIGGYVIKDRLGREIMGDNTVLIGEPMPKLSAGRRYRLVFSINRWPNLREQEYSLSVALADGTWNDHEQCHWIHDAVVFISKPERTPAGMFSILETDAQISVL